MAGVNTIKLGYIWRVGDGQNINIWSDPWIPQAPDRMVITRRGGQLLSKVADLINPPNGEWAESLVNQTFWPIHARRILAIPLPAHDMTDFIAWNLTKTGTFSVRSVYHIEWNRQFGSRMKVSNGMGATVDNPIWKTLWTLRCPSKIKIKVWRNLHGALPCQAVLADRHIKTPPQCLACNLSAETIKHMLFECKKAKDVWTI
mgnify:CR=1 FL=1